jgi:hypothetical protein
MSSHDCQSLFLDHAMRLGGAQLASHILIPTAMVDAMNPGNAMGIVATAHPLSA